VEQKIAELNEKNRFQIERIKFPPPSLTSELASPSPLSPLSLPSLSLVTDTIKLRTYSSGEKNDRPISSIEGKRAMGHG
jgi:hypothetical protein